MTVRPEAHGRGTWETDLDIRRPSFAIAGTGDAMILIGIVTIACALGGLGDDGGDAAWLALCGALTLGVGLQTRRRFVRPRRSTPSRILRGLGLIWCLMCLIGAAVYLATGTVDRIDDALLESTAGFTTTNASAGPIHTSAPCRFWCGVSRSKA